MNREDDKAKLTASSSIADKPMDWLIMPKAFQDATKLPGIPIGYSTCVMGHSNTGKSTLINHAIVAAQRQGIIPVIIDTENSFSFDYAVAMGFKAEPMYGDVDVEVVKTEGRQEFRPVAVPCQCSPCFGIQRRRRRSLAFAP